VADHALELHRLVGSLKPEQWACDKSQRQSIIELHWHGILAAPAPNDVVGGIQRLGSWFRARRLWLPEACCPKLIEQARGYRWAENVGSDGQMRREQVVKVQDDLIDALRYALMLWPYSPTASDDTGEPAQPGLRDLSQVPEEVRWSLERQRRCENPVDGEDELGEALSEPAAGDGAMADFWR
jgi:hypothetical protein